MKASVIRKAHFNAAHRLFRPEWSDEKNLEIFGGCSHPNYHGHNYRLEVKLTGDVDPLTGFVIDLKILRDVIDMHVIEKFDHKNLNLDTEEFASLNPTAENIAFVVWQILRNEIERKYDLSVMVFETDKNAVEYSGQ